MGSRLSARRRQEVLGSITVEEFKQLLDRFGLMGSSEAAQTVGVQQPNLDTVSGLPEPAYRVKATRLWVGEELRQFAADYVAPKRARRKVASV